MLDEAEIVRLLTKGAGGAAALGFADDAALLEVPVGCELVVSQDALIENVDFTAAFASEDVGHKALAANLSDLAAMGAEPLGYLQTLAVPRGTPRQWFEGFRDGAAALAARCGCPLLGGDLSRIDGPVVVAITVLGLVAKGRALRRCRVQPGDLLFVGGALGSAAAGLIDPAPELVRAQRRPEPQLALGRWLARQPGCRGAMDLSDGLAADLPRFLGALGASLDLAAIPISAETRAAAARQGLDCLAWATRGGEDFVLLTAAAPEAALAAHAEASGFSLHPIGLVEATSGVRVSGGGVLGTGFDHFR